jgi:hypothetical protein
MMSSLQFSVFSCQKKVRQFSVDQFVSHTENQTTGKPISENRKQRTDNWKLFLLLFIIAFLFPPSAHAHAFGQMYTLPIPAWLYIFGGGATVILSFLIIGMFVDAKKSSWIQQHIELVFPQYFYKKHTILHTVIKAISVFTLVLAICTGIFGTQSTGMNFNMTWFWILLLLGMTYAVAVLGNIWQYVHPWRILADIFIRSTEKKRKYPERLHYVPALLFFFFLIWIELLMRITPMMLSYFLLLYTLITYIGASIFGKEAWFTYADFFSVYFSIIERCAPLFVKNRKVYMRMPFAGLLENKMEHVSLLLFIIFMLSSTVYDGFRATTAWITVSYEYLAPINALLGREYYLVIQTIFLLLSPFLFYLMYLFFISVMKMITESKESVRSLALRFGFTLVPIALVYNIAHYYALFITQGQAILSLISDPFGLGWDIFHTASFAPNVGIISAGFVWHSQVALILVGHIASVYLAHVVALDVFKSKQKATMSQVAMLFLMVLYTMLGLWILSQPLSVG